MKGGKINMNKRIVLWIIIGVLGLAVLVLAFKSGAGTSSAGAVAQGAASSYSGMVGGC